MRAASEVVAYSFLGLSVLAYFRWGSTPGPVMIVLLVLALMLTVLIYGSRRITDHMLFTIIDIDTVGLSRGDIRHIRDSSIVVIDLLSTVPLSIIAVFELMRDVLVGSALKAFLIPGVVLLGVAVLMRVQLRHLRGMADKAAVVN